MSSDVWEQDFSGKTTDLLYGLLEGNYWMKVVFQDSESDPVKTYWNSERIIEYP